MALVEYSDSESEKDNRRSSIAPSPPRPSKKVRREDETSRKPNAASSLPPLPTNFHDLYASSTRVSVKDDPSLHGGRKRVIPHVEGNWPTHVYLEWYPSKSELTILNDVISQIAVAESEMKIHSLLQNDLGVYLPLHISLSRPVVLVTEQRQAFLELFQNAIQDSDIRPFNVTLEGLDWVCNYERTRWFLVMRIKKPENDGLNRLLKVSNRSLAAFGQPPLYETSVHSIESGSKDKRRIPRQKRSGHLPGNSGYSTADYSHCFHISIAWSLDEPSPNDRERVGTADLQNVKGLTVFFGSVKAKIGNSVSNIALPTRTLDEKGFGGL